MQNISSQAQVIISRQNYRTSIRAGNHEVIADEPDDIGGADEGPTSHQLLLAALGACTAITLKMYIQRKQWNIDDVKINLSLLRREDGTTGIQRNIIIDQEITDEQKEKLLKIADACPVHKTLTSPIDIQTSLK